MNMRQQNGQGGHGNHGGHRRGRNGGGNNRHGGGSNRHGSGGGGNGGNRGQVPLRNQIFDSHGPEGVRVRGNAIQVWEKYMTLAREAGERDEAESLYQHAEHYYRIVEAIQEVEAEQRARFAPDPASADQPAIEGEASTPAADPFAMAQPSSSAAETDSGLTDLRPVAAQ